eukprot:scaffold51772_cov17-Tisochrysis_lutea.AAC.1
MVGASPVGVLRASLASGLKFWVDGRTLACVGVWIECKGKAVLVLRYIRCVVLVLGGLAVGPGLPVGVCGRRRP